MEDNNRRVVDATKELVEADAQGRKENLELHRQIEAERTGISQQRDALESERRQLADQRNRDPIVAQSILTATGLIAAVLPLVVCIYLIRGLLSTTDEEEAANVLIEELTSDVPQEWWARGRESIMLLEGEARAQTEVHARVQRVSGQAGQRAGIHGR